VNNIKTSLFSTCCTSAFGNHLLVSSPHIQHGEQDYHGGRHYWEAGKNVIYYAGVLIRTGDNKLTIIRQGASVADVFLQEAGWHVRGVTRDPAKPESQAWAAKGVELVKADLNDAASLKVAFAGSTVVFGVTDFWGIVGDPHIQRRAQESGRPVNALAYELEVQQGRNVVDAAFGTLDTLDRFVLSTLSPTKKWSKGKYTHNFHFDAKWEAVEYLKVTYPPLEKKTSYLQVALYLSNWKSSHLGRPTKASLSPATVISSLDSWFLVKVS
jgi:hypothetical protein